MIKTVPSIRNTTEHGGRVKVARGVVTARRAFLPTIAASSELFDRIWGLELTFSKDSDESLFTPLGEPGAHSRENAAATGVGFTVIYDGGLPDGGCAVDIDTVCRIAAKDAEGLTRAFSLIAQIGERTCDRMIELPRCRIEDSPSCPFRALSLDVARRWHPVDFLYRYVDLLALYGMNRFVVHFTDDESYTLPCEEFPDLPTDGRHYTKSELAALSGYAAARGVMLIPEIDMPGHSAQFQMKYPEIFGKCGIMEPSEKMFDALGKIYREAAKLFPDSEYIHIGGDEAVLGRWNDSEVTAEYMKDNSIPDVVTLYGHVVGRVAKDILSIGKTPIVWEGFGKESNGEVPREALVASFENTYQTASQLVEAGFTVINASWRPFYCVAPWQKWSPEEILGADRFTFDHWWEKSAAYDRGVTVPKDAPVAGAMYCAWGDYMKNYESSRLACKLEWACVSARIPAMAEMMRGDGKMTFADYEEAVKKTEKLLSLIHGENAFRGKL